jgi:murein DD-endopeptidase MepM/ murein hydrolase activator NlpD
MWMRFGFRFAVVLVLAGCETGGVPQRAGIPPAQQPPPHASGRWSAFPAPLAKPSGGATVQDAVPAAVVVAPGDTVHGLADRYRVSIRDLIDANRLEPPYRLEPGRRLVMPSARIHRVRRGETLYGISRAYRSDMATVARLNSLAPPFGIYEGQALRLPVAVAPPAVVTVAAVEPPVAPGRGTTAPEEGLPSATIPAPPPAPSSGISTVPLLPPDASKTAAPSASASPPPPAARQEPPPPTTLAALPPSRAGSLLFAWPARGRMISGFGPKPGGQHNDGINIEVGQGTPVRAAEAGTVVYAGNELKGYGNLVLIRHAGGWVTAYAHNDDLLVRRGAQVGKGQQIARSGSSGGVSSPQLHFEIRKGRDPVDPMRYLGSPDTISGEAGRGVRTGPG